MADRPATYDEAAVNRIIEALNDKGIYYVDVYPQDGKYYVEAISSTHDGGEQVISLDFEGDGEIEDVSSWKKKLAEYADAYNPREEALLWVDSSGDGVRGAPGNVTTLTEGFERYQKKIRHIAETLSI